MSDSGGDPSTGLPTKYDAGIPGLYVTVIILGLIVLLIAIRTLCCQDHCNARNGGDDLDVDFFLHLDDTAILSPQQERELREKRRKFVLKHIVIKKAKRRREVGKFILPHEEELSNRRLSLLELPKDLEASNLNIDNDTSAEDGIHDSDSLGLMDEVDFQTDQTEKEVKKDDIIVDSFREWRSTRHGIDDSIQSSIYSPKSCSICMSRYKEGDEICWSRNEKCYHAFHLTCMLEWLLKHNDCPLCRRNYLRTDEPSRNEVENNNGHDRQVNNEESV
mmetsp:Transcript_9958/g.18698  ORF Transcript_9958/g.18698 Transcript_9958/m.18698 type:complete len:276 (-) Transcript_9958:70-897(-)